jgi:hypothetical protein
MDQNNLDTALRLERLEERMASICRKVEDAGKMEDLKIEAIKESIVASKIDLERRAEGWNNLREELKDYRSFAASKDTVDRQIEDVHRWRVEHLESTKNLMDALTRDTNKWRTDHTAETQTYRESVSGSLTALDSRARVTITMLSIAIPIFGILVGIIVHFWK